MADYNYRVEIVGPDGSTWNTLVTAETIAAAVACVEILMRPGIDGPAQVRVVKTPKTK